jgi:anaerobic ribonucleoside-triphosphate reductase activating protein
MPRTPRPDQWQAEKVSQGYVADYKPFVMVDGEGVRCSLYVSGCLFACEGCFNESTWNFRYGTAFTAELEERIISDLSQPYVQGLSLLGGEPFLNTGTCLRVIERLRTEIHEPKDIWCWTGYTFEELLNDSADKRTLLNEIDVLVDGRFLLELKDFSLQFRGSSNQRIIDVPQSLAAGHVVLWDRTTDASQQFEQISKRALI